MSISRDIVDMTPDGTRHILTDDAGSVLLMDFASTGSLDGISLCVGEESCLYDTTEDLSRHPLAEPGRYAGFIAGLTQYSTLSAALAAIGCSLPVATPLQAETTESAKIRLTRCLYVYADLYAALNCLPPAQDAAVSHLSARLAQYPAPARLSEGMTA
ncbi:hypothetical protein [Komagataeibacter europaeus]|uniref:hypothetical protein n=1 Tax=Komagataeibacter europaeus TaxID=33995 RepID=UPI00031DB2C6|nr:hypothetical protein [Komagataeibacter europaeus]GBQ47901.1 hypothetical protein AA18890_2845 [Komagataeibacter europaeus LMG 18890]